MKKKIFSGAAEPVHDAHAAANYGVCSGERFARATHPEENQAILEQVSALTGDSSDQVLSMLNALGLLDEDGNFKGGSNHHAGRSGC